MKKECILLAALCCYVFSMQAQVFQGQKILGGSVSFQSSKSNQFGANSVNTFNIQPRMLYFIGEQFAAGGSIGIFHSSSDGNSNSSFSFSPEARYYFGDLEYNPFFFSGSLGLVRTKSDGFFGDDTNTGFIMSFGPGINFFLNEHVALEGFVGYQRIAYDNSAQNTFAIRFGVSAFLEDSDE